MGNRFIVVHFSRGTKGRWQFSHQPGTKGPEPGSLRSCCRQRCSPSVPADEMCGGTGYWGSRLTWGVSHSPGGMEILGRILAQKHSDTRVKAPATKPWAARDKSHWRNLTGGVLVFYSFISLSLFLQPIQVTPHSGRSFHSMS